MISRLKYFQEYFEKENPRWKVFYKEELPENIQHNDVYFVITGDTFVNKRKIVNFSIYYIKSRTKDGLLEFRDEVQKFIKKDLANHFNTYDFFNTDGYDINYSIDDRTTLRIAEINCSYDYTRLRTENIEFPLMEKLEERTEMK